MNTSLISDPNASANSTDAAGRERAKVWVCGACGKRSQDECGQLAISPGWDESCSFNAFECYVDSLVMAGGRVLEVRDGGVVPAPHRETTTDALARLGREMDEWAANLGNPNKVYDPELLALARQAVDAMEARRAKGKVE